MRATYVVGGTREGERVMNSSGLKNGDVMVDEEQDIQST